MLKWTVDPALDPNAVDALLVDDSLLVVIVKAVLIVVFLLTSVLFAVWFERRVIARMQERPGPNVHGPFGLLQSIADAMKLLFKEDLTVRAADKLMYIAAPMISVMCALLIFVVVPFGPAVRIPFTDEWTTLQVTDLPVGVLYVLACAALGVYGIVLGGWASGSTYPLMGAVRSTAQVISYELAMGLSLVTVFMLAGSMSLSDIVASQQNGWWAGILFPAFVLYLISMVGETNRLPFDLPEAEGELVAGFMTEYSSMKFAWFFLAEYMNMLNVSAIATTLFLGGWRAPWPLSAIDNGVLNTGWWPILWFVIKIWMFMFLFVWIRGSVLRFRYDQFMKFGWKVLIPGGLIWITIFGVGRVFGSMPDFNLRQASLMVAVALGSLAIVFFLMSKKEDQAEVETPWKRKAEVIDAFADGYPVPPKPGQTLPASPRAGRTVNSPPVQKSEPGSDDE